MTEVCPQVKYVAGCDRQGNTTQNMLQQAREAAKDAGIAVVFAGFPDQYESEGFDRENMKMPKGHLRLLKAVTEVNPNTIIVLMCGSAVEVPWINRVKALLYMGLPGEAGADAIADLLYGRANPCGKLAESWPKRYEDCISSTYYAGNQKDAQYREGVYVGYRYYESAGIPVRFPFGYGLSYTSFAYSNLKIQDHVVQCTVKNTGTRTGKEIVQLYIEEISSSVRRPLRELKAFTKLELVPGESKTAVFELTDRSFAIWEDGWKIPAGNYRICIGRNSHDMVLSQEISINPGKPNVLPPENMDRTDRPDWYQTLHGIPTQEEFECLLGRKVKCSTVKKGEFTMEHTIMEMQEQSFIMKILYKTVEWYIAKDFGWKKDYKNPTYRMMISTAADCSLSGMKINARMNNDLLEGLLEIANGHYLTGIRYMLFGKIPRKPKRK